MAEKAPAMVKYSGMGAIPNAKGVTFRVWTPREPDCGKRALTVAQDNSGPNSYNHPTPDVEAYEEGTDGLSCFRRYQYGALHRGDFLAG